MAQQKKAMVVGEGEGGFSTKLDQKLSNHRHHRLVRVLFCWRFDDSDFRRESLIAIDSTSAPATTPPGEGEVCAGKRSFIHGLPLIFPSRSTPAAPRCQRQVG